MARRRRRVGQQVELLFVVDLVQDLDVLLPTMLSARNDDRFSVTVCMTSWLQDVAPWVPSRLAASGFKPIVVSRKQLLSAAGIPLSTFDTVVTASESTAAPHRFVHALVGRANALGLRTCTFQHGLENLGLTSREDGDHEFASQVILTWGPPEGLPDWVPASRRRRCVGVGRPQSASATPQPARRDRPLVAVFENLHWDRYPPEYTARFLADLSASASANAELDFVIRPHPAGLWLARNPEALAAAGPNLQVADPRSPEWRDVTAQSLIAGAAAVVTTPSTVSLDAAAVGRPVAVAAYGLDLPAYAPLPLLQDAEDWSSFLRRALSPAGDLADDLETFRARQCLSGDPTSRVLAALTPAKRRLA